MERYANQIKLIAHCQWNYLPQTLAAGISRNIKNFYVVSDYFDLNDLKAHKFSVSEPSLRAYSNLSDRLAKKPKFKGQNLNEPIIYALKDMLVFAMLAAEKSNSREEFQHKIRSGELYGSSGHYKIENGFSERKVYLGIWDRTKMKPIKVL
ncbi:MAG: hypothetical protein AB8G05_11410 [Oligoflexales bacterium]